ncbi:uncharacterized protein LOC124931474 [Impatiens glandulifera]|uniref:uncharacterized protein LOC124931474 n=1 Tax=Impatiens glandulifera TaxID=253017 RepID=UPI001FB1308D|nr:uncharacterized protein LOC124931474 [Impatiens glandulifera]
MATTATFAIGIQIQFINQHQKVTVPIPSSRPFTKHPFSISTSSSILIHPRRQQRRRQQLVVVKAAETGSMNQPIEKLGVKVHTNPPESKLSQLGVRTWPKWGCPPSDFPWTYSSKETCYLLKGKVKVYPEGSDEAVEIAAGDLVEFPKGMNCRWLVSETVDKHYKFE